MKGFNITGHQTKGSNKTKIDHRKTTLKEINVRQNLVEKIKRVRALNEIMKCKCSK